MCKALLLILFAVSCFLNQAFAQKIDTTIIKNAKITSTDSVGETWVTRSYTIRNGKKHGRFSEEIVDKYSTRYKIGTYRNDLLQGKIFTYEKFQNDTHKKFEEFITYKKGILNGMSFRYFNHDCTIEFYKNGQPYGIFYRYLFPSRFIFPILLRKESNVDSVVLPRTFRRDFKIGKEGWKRITWYSKSGKILSEKVWDNHSGLIFKKYYLNDTVNKTDTIFPLPSPFYVFRSTTYFIIGLNLDHCSKCDECNLKINKKYGLKEKKIALDVINSEIKERWKRRNFYVSRKMMSIYGHGWQEKYHKEVKDCIEGR